MPEWLMGTDCKSVGYAYVSSNLTRPNLWRSKIRFSKIVFNLVSLLRKRLHPSGILEISFIEIQSMVVKKVTPLMSLVLFKFIFYKFSDYGTSNA
jgi:hypothetical protein